MGARERQHNITQGEFAVSNTDGDVITTLLGSCVSACLWDPTARVGGMNHILLPHRARALERLSSGTNEMEVLINKLLNVGGVKTNLQAKVFGGAQLSENLGNIGASNVAFVFSFLRNEGIPVFSTDTGGHFGRLIRFWPATGKAQVKRCLGSDVEIVQSPKPCKSEGGVELF